MNQDDENDPAFAPLREAGQGESEGFEEAESLLIEHASHGDDLGTSKITQDAAGFDDPESASIEYGEADDEALEDV